MRGRADISRRGAWRWPMYRLNAFLGAACLGFAAMVSAEEVPSARVLERLRGLAGDWEGSLEWSGARTGTGPVRASYSTSGYGSAVVENLFMGDDKLPSMMSVYHLDGSDLRMTHYCGAQNQPRLKASRIDEAGGVVQFAFVDGTGLVEHPAHIAGIELRFLPDDRLVVEFTFEGAGKTSKEHIELKRTGPRRAAG